jgi:hypothetical protein
MPRPSDKATPYTAANDSRAEVEVPHVAALAYRDIVREAVRRCVLDWKAFKPDGVRAMVVERGIPGADIRQVVDYVGQQFRGLHEGNVVRYRLRPEDLPSHPQDPSAPHV